MLVFSKRPLLLSEIILGVAMVRTDADKDLNENKKPRKAKILESCMFLVRVIDREDDPNDGFLRLSHSAVQYFLLERSDLVTGPDPEISLVDFRIMQECCIKYLMQPKYSSLLVSSGEGKFCTTSGEDVTNQSLSRYFAKYWHHYFDMEELPERQELVERFLRSPNFLTCIQIQSIYVIGHFMVTFDAITDQGRRARRVLPYWMQGTELFDQCMEFISEWKDVLQYSLISDFNGEIDRCLWGSLSQGNFLSQTKGRYQVWPLCGREEEIEGNSMVGTPVISGNGNTVVTLSIQHAEPQSKLDNSTANASQQTDIAKAQVNVWMLDQLKPPDNQDQVVVEFKKANCDWNIYEIPGLYPFSLEPSINLVTAPDAFTIRQNGSILRLGSRLVALNGTSLFDLSHISASELGITSLDEFSTRKNIIVVCRRRAPRNLSIARELGEKKRRKALANGAGSMSLKVRTLQSAPFPAPNNIDQAIRRKRSYSSIATGSDESLNASESEDGGDDEKFLDDDSDEKSEADETDLSSDDSISVDNESDVELEDEGNASDHDGGSLSETDSTFTDEDSSSVNGSDGSVSSFQSNDSKNKLSDQHGHDSDPEAVSDIDSNSDGDADDDTENYPVKIRSWGRRDVQCDHCQEYGLNHFFYCNHCNDANFDMCVRCKHKGLWCPNERHRLYEIVDGNTVSIQAVSSFKLQQDMSIYSRQEGIVRRIFKYSSKNQDFIHYSPPELHPTLPLAVWPISGNRILLVDFHQRHTRSSILNLNTPQKKGMYHFSLFIEQFTPMVTDYTISETSLCKYVIRWELHSCSHRRCYKSDSRQKEAEYDKLRWK
jgi:hypothetical protein